MNEDQIAAVKFLRWQNNYTMTKNEIISHYGMDYINELIPSLMVNRLDRNHKSFGFKRQRTRGNGRLKSLDQMIDRRRSLGVRYKPYNKYRGHD